MPKTPTHVQNQPNTSKSIPTTVWFMGLAMCLMNISFVMVFGVSAVYLNSLMGVAVGWILFLEGLGETVSFLMKLVSGMISDYFKRRKPIILVGYTMVLISKFILAASSTFAPVFASTLLERVGNGTQGTPRDALIGDVAPHGLRGSCFGLKRSLGIAGSFMGAAIAFVIMYYTQDDFKTVFWLATIPAVLACSIVAFVVKEPKQHSVFTTEEINSGPKTKRRPLRWADLPRLGKGYWTLIVVTFLFMTARFGEHNLVLHAKNHMGLRDTYAPLIIMLYNATYCLSSYPFGKWSDRSNRTRLLTIAIMMLVLADVALGCFTTTAGILIGIALWGVQMGAVQAVLMGSIADMAPPELRGTAFGLYYMITAIAALIAGSIGGSITQYFGSTYAYITSGVIALGSILTLLIMRPYRGTR